MRRDAVRRLPVLDNGRVVGIVSLGDLALALEERTAGAEIFEQQQQHS
jgi:CBS domain-containing protein